MAEVVRIPVQGIGNVADFKARVERMTSIFRAIEAGGMLAAVPDCPVASDDHRAALTLLSIVESELLAIREELQQSRL